MGGEVACQLLSVLDATFVLVPEFSHSDTQVKHNARGTCTIRFDWLRKPHKMIFSSQPGTGDLLFSSFRAVDFAFYSILSTPTETEVGGTLHCLFWYFGSHSQPQVPTKIMDVQLQRHCCIVASCLGILRSITSHAHVLSVTATDDKGALSISVSPPSPLSNYFHLAQLFAFTASCR